MLLEATLGASRLQALNRANDAALQVIGLMDAAVDGKNCKNFEEYERKVVQASMQPLHA